MQMMTRRGMQWLSAAADEPERCQAVWAGDPRRPYALPVGRYFDLVVVDERIGIETFDQLERRGMPLGPVMVDWSAKHVGFFVPCNYGQRFAQMVRAETPNPPAYRYLGKGSLVVVPGPLPLEGDRYTWLRAPLRRPEVTVTRVAALAAMLVAASELVARADRYGQRHPLATEPHGENAVQEADHVE